MSDKNFMSYGDAETVLTDFANKLQFKQITFEAWNAMSPAQQEAYKEAHPCIQIKSAPSPTGDGVQTFAIPTSAWVANTGSDATEFPYVANILTSSFTDDFIPAEDYLLGDDVSAYPTAAEKEAIALVDYYVQFSSSGIRLRATAAPAVALKFVVRGAVFNTATQSDVRQFTLTATSWAANTGSDASEFPYVYEIANAGYPDSFIANEILVLGADISTYLTTAEETAKNLISPDILINSSGIRLRATGEPQTNLTLVIRG